MLFRVAIDIVFSHASLFFHFSCVFFVVGTLVAKDDRRETQYFDLVCIFVVVAVLLIESSHRGFHFQLNSSSHIVHC